MTTTKNIDYLKSLIQQRRKLICWGVSHNNIDDYDLMAMLSKLDKIVSSHALAIFIIDNYSELQLLPPFKNKKALEKIDKMYTDSLKILNNIPKA